MQCFKSFKYLAVLTIAFFTIIGCSDSSSSKHTTPGSSGTIVVGEGDYSISGTVSGAIAGDVTITLTGTASSSVVTDSSGNYSFTGLENGTYTLAPSKSGYYFTPISTTIIINGANVTGTNFSATAYTGSFYSISGTISGAWVERITITLAGMSTGSVVTGESGTYTITNLPSGNYTVTPSLAGYTFTNTSESVTISDGDETGVNFANVSAVKSYSISGTITYGGTKTGRVYITADNNNNSARGTSVALTGGSASYTIRGLSNSSGSDYTVSAYMDVIGNGFENAWDPSGVYGSAVAISDANATGIGITITDPGTVTVAKPTIEVFPSNGAAFIIVDEDSEINTAKGYKIYWGTGTPNTLLKTVNAGDKIYLQAGIADGTYYYRAVPLDGDGTEVTASASDVTSAITFPAVTVGSSVSGTITFTGGTVPAGRTIFIGLIKETAATYMTYFTCVTTTSAVSSQTYTIQNVPAGSYDHITIVDLNGNYIRDTGDAESWGNYITVDGNETGINMTVSLGINAISDFYVTSNNSATPPWSVNFYNSSWEKQIVSAVIVSGLKIPLPYDIGVEDGKFPVWINTTDASGTNVSPEVDDVYTLKCTYSDGTSEFVTGTVTVVPDWFATVLTTSDPSTAPTFTWTMPPASDLPTYYNVEIEIWSTTSTLWEYILTSEDIDAGQVEYNCDGNAEETSLPSGDYEWRITIYDMYYNEAATYAIHTAE